MADSPEQARVRQMLRARGEQLAPRVGTPQTEYVYVEPKGTRNGTSGSEQQSASRWGQFRDFADRLQQEPVVTTPNRVPRILGARPVLFASWGVAMLALSVDDFYNNKILPRPSRLWWGTLLFAMLALLSMSDTMVPLANALGIGYALTVLWDLFGGGKS